MLLVYQLTSPPLTGVCCQVRYTVEVGSFFTAVLLLLLLSTLHLTFVNNEVTTRCFTSHVQQSYPNIGDGAGTTIPQHLYAMP